MLNKLRRPITSLCFIFCFMPLVAFCYNGRQQTQFMLTSVKALTRMFAEMPGYDVSGRKQALLARVISAVAHMTNRMVDSYGDGVSKFAHGNATFWQLAKHLEEFSMIQKHQNNDEKELKQHYYVAAQPEIYNEAWWQDDLKSDLKEMIKFLLIAAEWGVSVYAVHQDRALQKGRAVTEIIRALLDCTLRYLFKEGHYKSQSWIGKVESVSSAVPCVWDAGRAINGLLHNKEKKREEIKICPYCKEPFQKGDLLAQINCAKQHSVFHRRCINSWFSSRNTYGNSNRGKCPCCRKEGKMITKNFSCTSQYTTSGQEDKSPESRFATNLPTHCQACNRQLNGPCFVAQSCGHACCGLCRKRKKQDVLEQQVNEFLKPLGCKPSLDAVMSAICSKFSVKLSEVQEQKRYADRELLSNRLYSASVIPELVKRYVEGGLTEACPHCNKQVSGFKTTMI